MHLNVVSTKLPDVYKKNVKEVQIYSIGNIVKSGF